jgi:hypothetical protein
MDWRKSSYSNANGGQCVETASGSGLIMVRDTKQDERGPVLAFSAGAWSAFASGIKNAES